MYLELEHLDKRFGEKRVVRDLSLGLAQGVYAGAHTATRAKAAVMLCRLLEG